MHTPIQVDLCVEARWIVPVVPYAHVYEHASVVVRDGKILDILPTEQAKQRYQAQKTQHLPQHILIPGLVNLHAHAAMTLMRGIADDLPLMTWLNDHIWPAEKQFVSSGFVRDGSLLACAEMLSGGVTCFNDMYFYPSETASAVIQSGMRANLGLVILEFPQPYANDADDYLQKGLEARDGWRGNPLLTSCLAPHAPYTVSNATFEKVVTYAEQLGVGIHLHLHETQLEISDSLKQYGVSPMRRLADIGVLGPNVIAAHCTCMSDEDMEIFAEYGCHAAHCPASNLKLASGISPVSNMLKKGINVGIGTDGAASNNRLDMFAEMRMASLLAKGITHDALAVPAATALQMATLNGARAMGLDDKIGSLESGKFADMTAVAVTSPDVMPCFDPISHLVYALGREHVSHVWIAGELRYQKLEGQAGIYAGIEPTELKEITSLWQARLNQYKG